MNRAGVAKGKKDQSATVGLPTFKDQVNVVSAGISDHASPLQNSVPLVEAQAITATQLERENWQVHSSQSIDLNDDPDGKTTTDNDVFTVKRATCCWAIALVLAIVLTAGAVAGVFCAIGNCSASTNSVSTEAADNVNTPSGNLRTQTPFTPTVQSSPRPSSSPVESFVSTNDPTTSMPANSAAPISAAPINAAMNRAIGITTLVNQRTLSDMQFEYPRPTDKPPNPGQRALENIIEFSTWLDEQHDEVMERFALLSLWYSTGGAAWSLGTQWSSQVTVCQWPSVQCNNDGRVSALLLWNNQLRNELPADIGLLTSLTTLGLGDNDLSGTIPETIAKCTLLQQFALDRNQIGGTVPSELSQLSALTSLNLAVNILQGSLPSLLSTMTQLKEFHIDNNAAIIGNIPSELASWTSLRKGFFFNTNLRGVMPVCGSTNQLLEELIADCDDVVCECCTACCPFSTLGVPAWASDDWPCILM